MPARRASAIRSGKEASPYEYQAAFFQRMGQIQQFRQLFDYAPDLDFFAKDAEGRFVAVSMNTLRRVGLTREDELLGRDDTAIHPPNVARAIREDDLEVMRSRRPLVDRVEALYTRTRAKDWYRTTKLPILDPQGEVIGIMGFVRPYREGGGEEGLAAQMQRVVAHIHARFQEALPVAELAKIARLSERQLNRRFQDAFRISPQEFIVRTRIQAASDALLNTEKPVSEIAVECGFYDQSAFTRQFRQHLGETPAAFRRRRVRSE